MVHPRPSVAPLATGLEKGHPTAGSRSVSEQGAYVAPSSLDANAELLDPELPGDGLIWRRSGKRLFDILVSLVVAPLVLPVIAGASAFVLLTMGRPVFFRQARVGRGGRPFMILKDFPEELWKSLHDHGSDGRGPATFP